MTEIKDTVSKLIESLKDGEEGYRQAAEKIKNPEYKRFFEQQSTERGRFATELQPFMGDKEKDSGSVSGALHRTWIDLKGKLGAGDAAILSSVEQGEDSAKQIYEDALKASPPAELVAIIRRQYASVKNAHDRVKSWRDSEKAA
jgi:uncharacterized protein (TIGR02284 family)